MTAADTRRGEAIVRTEPGLPSQDPVLQFIGRSHLAPAAVAGIVQELIDLSHEERDERRKSMLERANQMARLGMTTVRWF